MTTRKFIVSLLMFACTLLAACAPTTAPASIATAIPSTATLLPAPVPPPSDPSALTALSGVYSYKVGTFTSSMLLLLDGDYRGPSTGRFGVTPQHITFVGGFSCTSESGTYTWLLKDTTLTLAVVKDDCRNRVDFFGKTLFEKASEHKDSASVIWAIGVASNPDVAIDQDGNIYTTLDSDVAGPRGPASSYYAEFDANGRLLKKMKDWIQYMFSTMTIDDQGNFYVSDFSNSSVHKFDSSEKLLFSWAVDSGNPGPTAIAVDARGNVYVGLGHIHDHYIEKYDPQGKLIGTWAKSVSAGGEVAATDDFSGAGGIVVDGNGNIYLEDDAEHKVFKYDNNGNYLETFSNVMGGAVDEQGNFYTSDKDKMNILKFNEGGKQIEKWSLPFLGTVSAMDKDGTLLILGNAILAKVQLPLQ